MGQHRWFYEPDDLAVQSLSVCISTFKPGGEQKAHHHAGEEQILYIISGKGVHYVNDQEERLAAGNIVRTPSNAIHSVINTSKSEELRILLVYNPSRFRPSLDPGFAPDFTHSFESIESGEPVPPARQGILSLFDLEGLDSIRTTMERLSRTLGLSLALLDNACSGCAAPAAGWSITSGRISAWISGPATAAERAWK